MPTLATSVVSGRRRRTTQRISRGTTKRPMTTMATRNATSLPVVLASVTASSPAPLEIVVIVASRRIAMMSSMMRTP